MSDDYVQRLENAVLEMSRRLAINTNETVGRGVPYCHATFCAIIEHHDDAFVPLIREIKERRSEAAE